MSWSLTSLQTFEQCGKKYFLKYVEKIPEVRNQFASRGVDLHKIIESQFGAVAEPLPPDLTHYAQFFDNLQKYECRPEHKLALTKTWEACAWDSPDVWWRGVIDLLVLPTEEVAYVYDWKTGKIYPDHDDQKEIYSIAVGCHFPNLREVRAIHVYVDLGRNKEKHFHVDQLLALRDRWVRRALAPETAVEFIPNPTFKCRYCSYSREKGGPCPF